MYHPTRGGTRGGAAEFSWETVKASKDREFYLGNSVAAPTGRWQDGRDINWYNKDAASTSQTGHAEEQRRAELRAIKQAEEEALYARLGRKPPPATPAGGNRLGQNLAAGSASYIPDRSTGANTAPIDASKSRPWKAAEKDITDEDRNLARKLAKEQVKNDMKRQRRDEKELIREERRRRREADTSSDRHSRRAERDRHERRHSEDRSPRRSPRRHSRDRYKDHDRATSRRNELSSRDVDDRRRLRSYSRSPERDQRRERHRASRSRSRSPRHTKRHPSTRADRDDR